MTRHFRLGLLLSLGTGCSGCSFLFMDAAPEHRDQLVYFDCTLTAGPIVADGTVGALTGLVAAAEISTTNNTQANTNAAAFDLALTGLFASSMVYGIVRTSQCREAKAELRHRLIELATRDAKARADEARRQRAEARAALAGSSATASGPPEELPRAAPAESGALPESTLPPIPPPSPAPTPPERSAPPATPPAGPPPAKPAPPTAAPPAAPTPKAPAKPPSAAPRAPAPASSSAPTPGPVGTASF